MLNERDVPTIKIAKSENIGIDLGISSIIGTRPNQEDRAYVFCDGNRALGVVCDGMGGHAGGEIASQTAIDSIVNEWKKNGNIKNITSFLSEQAKKADELVYNLCLPDGQPLKGGTTMVAVIIQDEMLHWLSIGDSRIYIARGNEIMPANKIHNYRAVLDEKLTRGEIDEEVYNSELYKGEALTSYVGIGNISLIDVNMEPFYLADGDCIILCSDGLYRSLTEEKIMELFRENIDDMQKYAETLTTVALGDKVKGQDNTSVVVLRYYEK